MSRARTFSIVAGDGATRPIRCVINFALASPVTVAPEPKSYVSKTEPRECILSHFLLGVSDGARRHIGEEQA